MTNEPKAFDSFMAHYGKFSGVKNYIALIGKKSPSLDERCGYYGERLVLLAQQLGLNTCWVAMTYSKVKNAYVLGEGEKLCVVIALGYGVTQGTGHKIKTPEDVVQTKGVLPDWFKRGIKAALLAPARTVGRGLRANNRWMAEPFSYSDKFLTFFLLSCNADGIM